MPAPAMTTLVCGDALTPVEQLDRPGRCADIDLLADQAMGYRVEEAVELDMIIEETRARRHSANW